MSHHMMAAVQTVTTAYGISHGNQIKVKQKSLSITKGFDNTVYVYIRKPFYTTKHGIASCGMFDWSCDGGGFSWVQI